MDEVGEEVPSQHDQRGLGVGESPGFHGGADEPVTNGQHESPQDFGLGMARQERAGRKVFLLHVRTGTGRYGAIRDDDFLIRRFIGRDMAATRERLQS